MNMSGLSAELQLDTGELYTASTKLVSEILSLSADDLYKEMEAFFEVNK